MNREPSADLRLQLRQAVNHGCPIPGCRSPFLEYHHFDPPWATENHMDPAGMIGLCPSHHSKADSWTAEQLREFRSNTQNQGHPAQGRFEWWTRRIAIVCGGMFVLDCDIAVEFRGERMVWFERDEAGFALLNVRMLTTNSLKTERLRIQNGDFTVRGDPSDFVCPPNGRLLRVRYSNGDYLRLQFRLIESVDHARAVFPRFDHSLQSAEDSCGHMFPIATVETSMHVGADRAKRLYPNTMNWNGIRITGGLSIGGTAALSLA